MKFTEITTKEALHKLNRRGLPYKYDLNIYRGCSHGCKYCYAVKSHEYFQSNNFEREIFVKTNIAEALDEALSSPSWKNEVINLGGVCDSYQHAEKRYQLMPDVLKVLIKHKNPIILSTKSDLILRDIDLLDELAHHTTVNIAMCITSIDDGISRNVEPGASLPTDRFKALCELSKTKIRTGLHIFPILPLLADDEKTLETLVKWADIAKVDYLMAAMLYMTGGIRKRYLSFVKDKYPKHYVNYLRLYQKGGADKEYKTKIHSFIKDMRIKYNINSPYSKTPTRS